MERITEGLGRAAAWLLPVMVVISVTVVLLRYLFDAGSIVLQESVLYLHAVVFLLGIPYTLKHDAHVRVDILYSRLGPRGRALIDLIGHLLFLIPVSLAVIFYSQPYVARAWRILEGSPEVGGIPAVFLLKTLIPVSAFLLLLQGLAEVARCLRRLRCTDG